MILEYRNGVRITPLVHEMSPLENAIQRYEEMATKYYSQSNQELNLTQQEREQKKREAHEFLATERRQLETIAVVQASLEAYREQGMKIKTGTREEQLNAISTLRNEEHHPTKTLEKYMLAEGEPKPSSQHTAHHLVLGSGRWRKVLIARARTHMHVRGIRINDPANGVYLLHKDEDTPHWSMPGSRGHLTYHTALYEEWVSFKVRQHDNIDVIKTQLQVIGRLLQNNEPKVALSKLKTL